LQLALVLFSVIFGLYAGEHPLFLIFWISPLFLLVFLPLIVYIFLRTKEKNLSKYLVFIFNLMITLALIGFVAFALTDYKIGL
jgi:hypothetical protein